MIYNTPVMSFCCALLSNHLRDFNKHSKLADCARSLLVIYILHDIFYLSLTCRIIFNFLAVDSSANLKLTILLCKRRKWCLCWVNVWKKKLPWSLCLYCSGWLSLRWSFVEFTKKQKFVKVVCVYGEKFRW